MKKWRAGGRSLFGRGVFHFLSVSGVFAMPRLVFALLFALLAIFGCSEPKSRVHGKVLYKGKPVTGGTIVLVSPDNSTAQARIASDGSYEVPAASRGHILVAIQADRPRPAPRAQPSSKAVALKGQNTFAMERSKSDDRAKTVKASAPPPAGNPSALGLPALYGDPNRSGLSIELVDSVQEFTVDLK